MRLWIQTLRPVTHPRFYFFLSCYIIHRRRQSERRGEIRSRPQWTLPHSWSMTSTFQKCIKLCLRVFFVFFKPHTLELKWEASHVQSESACLFFWNNLSFPLSLSLSLKHISSLTVSLSNPPPLSVSLSFCHHTAQVLCYCTPLHAQCCVIQSTQLNSGRRILQILNLPWKDGGKNGGVKIIFSSAVSGKMYVCIFKVELPLCKCCLYFIDHSGKNDAQGFLDVEFINILPTIHCFLFLSNSEGIMR